LQTQRIGIEQLRFAWHPDAKQFAMKGKAELTVRVLALDLEGTLISDAISAEPRPGLFGFLEFCQSRFDRVVLFTCVEEPDAREILNQLSCGGHVPTEFLGRLEYIRWDGEYKDLKFIPNSVPEEVLLVDDDPGWVRSDQRDRWVAITAWDGRGDCELLCTQSVLESRLNSRAVDSV